MVDPNYGPKRLLRAREFVAAAAWPEVPGDPGQITDTAAAILEAGNSINTAHGCNGHQANGVTQLGSFLSGDELPLSDSKTIIIMGSVTSSNCVSRYGAQDLIGNVTTNVSDQLSGCDQTSYACSGTSSALDLGNLDMTYYNFDGSQGPGGGGVNFSNIAISALSNGITSLSLPLGLPMVGNDSGNALTIGGAVFAASKIHATQVLFLNQSALVGTRSGAYGGGYDTFDSRYSSSWAAAPSSNPVSVGTGFRCALPAE